MKQSIAVILLLMLISCGESKPSTSPIANIIEPKSSRVKIVDNAMPCVFLIEIDGHLYGSTCNGGLTHLESCEETHKCN